MQRCRAGCGHGGRIPDANRAVEVVIGGCGQPPAIRAEGDALDVAPVASKRKSLLAGSVVPETQPPTRRTASQAAAITGKGYRMDGV